MPEQNSIPVADRPWRDAGDEHQPKVCPTCEGHGVVDRTIETLGGYYFDSETCPDCGGRGVVRREGRDD